MDFTLIIMKRIRKIMTSRVAYKEDKPLIGKIQIFLQTKTHKKDHNLHWIAL